MNNPALGSPVASNVFPPDTGAAKSEPTQVQKSTDEFVEVPLLRLHTHTAGGKTLTLKVAPKRSNSSQGFIHCREAKPASLPVAHGELGERSKNGVAVAARHLSERPKGNHFISHAGPPTALSAPAKPISPRRAVGVVPADTSVRQMSWVLEEREDGGAESESATIINAKESPKRTTGAQPSLDAVASTYQGHPDSSVTPHSAHGSVPKLLPSGNSYYRISAKSAKADSNCVTLQDFTQPSVENAKVNVPDFRDASLSRSNGKYIWVHKPSEELLREHVTCVLDFLGGYPHSSHLARTRCENMGTGCIYCAPYKVGLFF